MQFVSAILLQMPDSMTSVSTASNPWVQGGVTQLHESRRRCHHLPMQTLGELSHEEECLLINASEHDLLPGTLWDWMPDLELADKLPRLPVLAEALLGLVDRGLIEVRRITPELAAAGRYDVVSRADLDELLADPASWQYTERGWDERDEGLCIVMVPKRLTRLGVPSR
ncbi:hypothetical protein CS0771_75480 [Catellatospora sp. IY07-71]|nr:hypothetical protein CS0771_75480 [Catellatospora sp. IY07-71]